MAVTRSRGQVRLVELVVAVFMVVAFMVLVIFFARPMRSVYLREVSDLRRLAYNLLSDLADSGVFERIVWSAFQSDATWEGRMRMVASASLPAGVLFRMEIYEVRQLAGGTVGLVRLDRGGITNVEPGVELLESEAAYYTYVCVRDPDEMRGKMLYIVLVIGYAG